MTIPNGVRHIFHLAVNGGERHRYAILLAAEIAAAKGYRVDDMTRFIQNDYQPDLVIRKQDRFRDGARRRTIDVAYWVEIIDTSDPPREFVRPPCEVLRIDIAGKPTLEAVVEAIKWRIP